MPYYRIDIRLSNGKTFHLYRREKETDLDAYYLRILEQAQRRWKGGLSAFDVVQISQYSPYGKFMEEQGISRWPEDR